MARITGKAFDSLASICRDVLAKHPNAAMQYKEAGLSKKRFIWVVFNAAMPLDNWDCEREAGGYWVYNDAHIETALNKIIEY